VFAVGVLTCGRSGAVLIPSYSGIGLAPDESEAHRADRASHG